ncbi:hypothetical protein HanHA300_Chr13g0463921 [Helianthus annuus]|nr:hypothetical protein HanHA300_Chr13g0463921 [Helianthus annuus]
MSLFLSECRLNSALGYWVLGVSRLGMSLCLGDIRQDQIFAVWFSCFSSKVYFFSSKQRSENLWLGQRPVCVVYFGSFWISTLVPKGGGVSFWESGGIRDSKAKRVVILLNSLCHSSAVIFHSDLFLCLIGNLILFLCFVVSLKGSFTILTTSATACGRLGFVVLGGGTHHGEIRLEIATMFRTLYSTPILVFNFLDLISGNQSQLYWFLSKPVSWFFDVSFESDLLGSKGILGSWGWAVVIKRRDFVTMLVYLDVGRLLIWNFCYKGSSTDVQTCGADRCNVYVRRLISWCWLIKSDRCNRQKCRGYVKTDLEWQGHYGNSVKVLKRECWALDSFLNAVVRQIERIWKDSRSYQHCRMLFGLLGLFCSFGKVLFGIHRRLQGYYWKYASSRIILQGCDDVYELLKEFCRTEGVCKLYEICSCHLCSIIIDRNKLFCKSCMFSKWYWVVLKWVEAMFEYMGKVVYFSNDSWLMKYTDWEFRIKNWTIGNGRFIVRVYEGKRILSAGQVNWRFVLLRVCFKLVLIKTHVWNRLLFRMIIADNNFWPCGNNDEAKCQYWLVGRKNSMMTKWPVVNYRGMGTNWFIIDMKWITIWGVAEAYGLVIKLGLGMVFGRNWGLGYKIACLGLDCLLNAYWCWYVRARCTVGGKQSEWPKIYCFRRLLKKLSKISFIMWGRLLGVGVIRMKSGKWVWAESILGGIFASVIWPMIVSWILEKKRWWAKSIRDRKRDGSSSGKLWMCGWAWAFKMLSSLNSLVFKFWFYEMGLSWPVGFRYGLGLYRKAHFVCFYLIV